MNPKISLTGTDRDNASLTETNASLTESGTLTLTDIDVKDAVSTVKVDSIVKGGTYAGTLPTDGVLKDMLSISNGALTDSETGGKINWNFNSGSELNTNFFTKMITIIKFSNYTSSGTFIKSLNRRWWDCWGRGSPAGLSTPDL